MSVHIERTAISDIIVLRVDSFADERGQLYKPYSKELLNSLNINVDFGEELIVSSKKHVIRGLHFQYPPFAQEKLVFCISGRVNDVAVDLRRDSPTFGQHIVVELPPLAESATMAYIPQGFAHGYEALEDSLVGYMLGGKYAQEYDGGIRWDSAGIKWVTKNPVLSAKDKLLPGMNEIDIIF